jgi:predicted transcriptional regulator
MTASPDSVNTSTTLRVSTELHHRIAMLANSRGQRMQDIIAQAIDAWEQTLFWEEFDASWERIRNDPEQWAQVQADRAVWDRTLKDGLEPDEDEW